MIDGTGKPPVPNAVVVVRGDRIVAAGKGAPIPAGARVIEAAGRTLLPGLIDMHTHITVQEDLLPLFLANGITAIRDLGCADEKLGGLIRLREDLAANRAVGPRLFLAGESEEQRAVDVVLQMGAQRRPHAAASVGRR